MFSYKWSNKCMATTCIVGVVVNYQLVPCWLLNMNLTQQLQRYQYKYAYFFIQEFQHKKTCSTKITRIISSLQQNYSLPSEMDSSFGFQLVLESKPLLHVFLSSPDTTSSTDACFANSSCSCFFVITILILLTPLSFSLSAEEDILSAGLVVPTELKQGSK